MAQTELRALSIPALNANILVKLHFALFVSDRFGEKLAGDLIIARFIRASIKSDIYRRGYLYSGTNRRKSGQVIQYIIKSKYERDEAIKWTNVA